MTDLYQFTATVTGTREQAERLYTLLARQCFDADSEEVGFITKTALRIDLPTKRVGEQP